MKATLLAIATVIFASSPSQAGVVFDSNIPFFDYPFLEPEVILEPQKELMDTLACSGYKQS
jgi:hypothetical protein